MEQKRFTKNDNGFVCAHCGKEGQMHSEGIVLWCESCGKKWEMTELGQLKALEGETEFAHIPDWYSWERRCVREEIERGEYMLDIPVEMYTPLFAISRVAGWCAHRIEEVYTGGRIIRPAYRSMVHRQEYVTMENR